MYLHIIILPIRAWHICMTKNGNNNRIGKPVSNTFVKSKWIIIECENYYGGKTRGGNISTQQCITRARVWNIYTNTPPRERVKYSYYKRLFGLVRWKSTTIGNLCMKRKNVCMYSVYIYIYIIYITTIRERNTNFHLLMKLHHCQKAATKQENETATCKKPMRAANDKTHVSLL